MGLFRKKKTEREKFIEWYYQTYGEYPHGPDENRQSFPNAPRSAPNYAPQSIPAAAPKKKGLSAGAVILVILLVLAGIYILPRIIRGYNNAKNARDVQSRAQTYTESKTTVTASSDSEMTAEPAPAEYHVGDTWTVEGQWSLTLESVEKTNERNQYTDEKKGEPAEVYSLTYTYENLGYTSDVLEGLYMRLDRGTIIDSTGLLGDSYPLSGSGNAEYTPVGAKCQVQSFIALKNPGGFRIEMHMYDGNKEKQTAVFVFE